MKRAPIFVACLVLAGCPDKPQPAITPVDGATRPIPPAPPPPPAPPREGWQLVGAGSVFETVTKTHFENGLPDSDRTAVQTVVAVDPDGVKVQTDSSQNGVADPQTQPAKYLFKSDAKDPDAKPAKIESHETVTVKAGTFECDVTSEEVAGSTTRTWRTKAFPVPVKSETKGEGMTTTSELVRAEVKKP